MPKVKEPIVPELADNTPELGEPDHSDAPVTISVEQYNALYEQAVALEQKFTRLVELFNTVVEKFLTCDNKRSK